MPRATAAGPHLQGATNRVGPLPWPHLSFSGHGCRLRQWLQTVLRRRPRKPINGCESSARPDPGDSCRSETQMERPTASLVSEGQSYTAHESRISARSFFSTRACRRECPFLSCASCHNPGPYSFFDFQPRLQSVHSLTTLFFSVGPVDRQCKRKPTARFSQMWDAGLPRSRKGARTDQNPG